MGKITGFIEFDRKEPNKQTVDKRVQHSKEFIIPLKNAEIKNQAARCMNCGVPFCQSDYGCPLGNVIPDFNDAVYKGNWEEALESLLSTNNFPEFTGRICPAPCETACVLGINKPAVAIKNIEVSIIERAFKEGWIKSNSPTHRTGKEVAVIGSGPSGLAVADQLNQSGHLVTVFERDNEAGGLLRYGIPDFKLEKSIVQRRIDLLKEAGISFRLGCNVGKDIQVSELQEKYDAIVLCGGCTVPRDLPIQGRNLRGIYFAMEFLKQANQSISGESYSNDTIDIEGKDVVVIGGGDTGSDCIGSSVRRKAKSITQLEIMPTPPDARDASMPWPQYPRIFRVSTSQEEAGKREFAVITKEFLSDDNGNLKGIRCAKIKWENNRSFKEVEGSEFILSADRVFLAMGFIGSPSEGLIDSLGVQLDEKGNVASQNNYVTSEEGVFVCGDMRRGQSLVVWAIADGRECARSVDRFLVNKSSSLNAINQSFYSKK